MSHIRVYTVLYENIHICIDFLRKYERMNEHLRLCIKSTYEFGLSLKLTSILFTIGLTLSCITIKNGQTYFKYLAVYTLQDF